MFSKRNSKMTKSFLSGIGELVLGQFVGFLEVHSSMVGNVRHLTTGYISPQFHAVFDDLFETVNCTGVDDQVIKSICNGLFQHNNELYAEDELNEAGNSIYQPPPLHEVWLDEAGCRQGNEDHIHQFRCNEDLMPERNHAVRKSSIHLLLRTWMMQTMFLVLYQFLMIAV